MTPTRDTTTLDLPPTLQCCPFFDFEEAKGAIDLRVEYYKPLHQVTLEDPAGLVDGVNTIATLTAGGATTPDSCFGDKGEIKVIEINNEIYVSATTNNKYSAGLIPMTSTVF